MHPRLDVAADARAVFDAVVAVDVCEPQGSSSKFHLISVRDMFVQGMVGRMHWVDVRDPLADGLANGGVARICCALSATGSAGSTTKISGENAAKKRQP